MNEQEILQLQQENNYLRNELTIAKADRDAFRREMRNLMLEQIQLRYAIDNKVKEMGVQKRKETKADIPDKELK
jgi:hypothetical protein